MYLGAKLKNILEYYQEQITLVMDLMFTTYYILENEFNEFDNLKANNIEHLQRRI